MRKSEVSLEIDDNGCEESMRLPISVIILTYNEEKNIRLALESVCGWVQDIFLVDSFSTDGTLDIARKFGAQIFQNPWMNYATQLNWALEHLPLTTEWVMRLDADEQVMLELMNELKDNLPLVAQEVSGLYVKRRVYFMGRWIRRGGYYPTWLLRIWRRGHCRCEARWMDEHMKLEKGNTLFLQNDIVDDNKNNLHWWINKHNSYATREAIDILNMKYHILQYDEISANMMGTQEERKRWLKNVYVRLPLFFRAFLYFIYRYLIKLGILDGKEGLIWHFLQGFWYRFLVDAKIYEVEKIMIKGRNNIEAVIEEKYGIKFR